jgi:hypothetical protein
LKAVEVGSERWYLRASVPDSNVYVLSYNENRRVDSTLLDLVNRAGFANEILRDILGVPFTVPIWVDERVNQLIENFKQKALTEESLRELKQEMSNLGLDHVFPDALARVLEQVQ